jgi:hypothetical protein
MISSEVAVEADQLYIPAIMATTSAFNGKEEDLERASFHGMKG